MNIACLCVQQKTWILPFQTGCIDLARVCLCQPFAAFPPKRLRANILDTPLLTFGCQGKCCFLNYLEASTNLKPRYNSTNLKPRSQHRAAKQSLQQHMQSVAHMFMINMMDHQARCLSLQLLHGQQPTVVRVLATITIVEGHSIPFLIIQNKRQLQSCHSTEHHTCVSKESRTSHASAKRVRGLEHK